MTIHDGATIPTYAPLLAQRRRLRERALTAFYRRHGEDTAVLIPAVAARNATAAAARPSASERGGRLRRVLGALFGGHRDARSPGDGKALVAAVATSASIDAAARTPRGSAAETAALVQRLTGPGSGPYSGTPFRSPADTAGDPERTSADTVSEAARHDHGIIDHSRHVASIGRR